MCLDWSCFVDQFKPLNIRCWPNLDLLYDISLSISQDIIIDYYVLNILWVVVDSRPHTYFAITVILSFIT